MKLSDLHTDAQGYDKPKAEPTIPTTVDSDGTIMPKPEDEFIDGVDLSPHGNQLPSQNDTFTYSENPHRLLKQIPLNGADDLIVDDSDPIDNMSKLHHMAAYLYAHGNSFEVVSLTTGISTQQLKTYVEFSYSWQTAYTFYKSNPEQQPAFKPQDSANLILCEAVDEILRRLSTDASSFSNRELMQAVELMSTRTDLGLNPKESKKDEGVDKNVLEDIKTSTAAESKRVSLPKLEKALEARRNIVGGSDGPTVSGEVLERQRQIEGTSQGEGSTA